MSSMPGATDSEFNIFKTLTNPGRTDFESGASVVSRAINDELHKSGGGSPNYTPPSSPRRSHYGDADESSSRARRSEPEPEDACEKQSMLLELNALAREGVLLTRAFTMEDSQADMLFELNRIRANLDAASSVGMMLQALKMGMVGMELANNKWGPIMHLTGWSSVIDNDSERYRRVLGKLYKKHWRTGAMMSPELELAMLLGGGAFMHHVSHKLGGDVSPSGGGGGGGLAGLFSMFTGAPATGAAPPPPAPPADMAGGGSFSQRPPMRRPTTASSTPPPEATQTHDHKMAAEMEELRAERAMLQAQLRKQASFTQPFVVMSSSRTGPPPGGMGPPPSRRGHGPQIVELS